MTAAILGLIARHVLTALGSYLVMRGIDESSAQTIIGAVSTLGGLAWSYINKRNLLSK